MLSAGLQSILPYPLFPPYPQGGRRASNDTSPKESLPIQQTVYDTNGRYYLYVLDNNKGLEGEDLFRALYNTLYTNPTFLDFEYNKVILTTALGDAN